MENNQILHVFAEFVRNRDLDPDTSTTYFAVREFVSELTGASTRELDDRVWLKPGIYVTKTWADQPERSIAWVLDQRGNWRSVSLSGNNPSWGTPEQQFGADWRNSIVRVSITAEY